MAAARASQACSLASSSAARSRRRIGGQIGRGQHKGDELEQPVAAFDMRPLMQQHSAQLFRRQQLLERARDIDPVAARQRQRRIGRHDPEIGLVARQARRIQRGQHASCRQRLAQRPQPEPDQAEQQRQHDQRAQGTDLRRILVPQALVAEIAGAEPDIGDRGDQHAAAEQPRRRGDQQHEMRPERRRDRPQQPQQREDREMPADRGQRHETVRARAGRTVPSASQPRSCACVPIRSATSRSSAFSVFSSVRAAKSTKAVRAAPVSPEASWPSTASRARPTSPARSIAAV